MLAYRCLECVGPLALCTGSGLGVLRFIDSHDRNPSLEALLPWRCRLMMLNILGEVAVDVVGLLLLELALVICMERSQMY